LLLLSFPNRCHYEMFQYLVLSDAHVPETHFFYTNRGDQNLAQTQPSAPLAHQLKLRLEAFSSEKITAASSLLIRSEPASHSSVKP
jgi:hypothetical protein